MLSVIATLTRILRFRQLIVRTARTEGKTGYQALTAGDVL